MFVDFYYSHHDVKALITPEELKSHLSLLRTFYDLKQKVELDTWLPQSMPEDRWTHFVCAAVEWCVLSIFRSQLQHAEVLPDSFDRWSMSYEKYPNRLSANLKPLDLLENLPPVDVMMVCSNVLSVCCIRWLIFLS
jgi:hypothetical protein